MDKFKNASELFKSCNIYIMCSTLNQVVNYIPLKMILKEKKKETTKSNKKVEIIYITISSNSNQKWDKNMKVVLETLKEEQLASAIKRPETEKENLFETCMLEKNIEDYVEKIKTFIGERQNDKKQDVTYMWNITGGQKSLIFAIRKAIEASIVPEEKHIFLYLEGNTNQCAVECISKQDDRIESEFCPLKGKYFDEELTIKTALQLAGFKINEKSCIFKKENGKFCNSKEGKKVEVADYIYKAFEENEGFRAEAIGCNKGEAKDKEKNQEEFKKRCQELLKTNELKEAFEKICGKNDNFFGYILEYMALSKLIKVLESDNNLADQFLEIGHSIKLKGEQDQFCEFDLVLLTKGGQILIIECKSGNMDSNVSKARIYTTYAAAGVYGKPILITPLLKEELEKAKKHNLKNGDYEYILKAIGAAQRSQMEIWALDSIEEDLRNWMGDIISKRR
ncbi:hypothetical protein NDGK_00805 [Clostridiales bacterium CHKCI001]|nr:hypothetical protein NDGK_00805 [Clostridiales bacterium CHKCI001]